MALKKAGKKRISALFARSKILGFFSGIASFLYDKAGSSIAGKIFSGYDKVSSDKGFVNRLSEKASLGSVFFRPIKRTVSRLVSQSVILRMITAFLYGFLYTGMNIYGLFFMSSGIGFLAVALLKAYVIKSAYLSFTDTFLAILLIVVSIPLLFSKAAFTSAVCKSRFASAVIFDWFGGKREIFEKECNVRGDGRLALLFGVVLCVLSWWIRPIALIALIVVFVATLTVLYNPESGIVVLLLVLPFMSADMLNNAVLYVGICFLLKYIRGKRTIKFDTLAATVLCFAILCIINNTSSVPSYVSTPLLKNMLCGLCAFFLIVNLIKSKTWIDRCLRSICLSGFLVVLYGIVRYAAVQLEMGYLTSVFGATENETVVSCFGSSETFADYLVIIIPFLIAGMNYDFKNKKALCFFGLIMGFVCLFLTGAYFAWVAVVIGIVVFMVLYGKKTLAFLLGGLCVLPFVYYNLPQEVLSEISLLNRVSGYVADRVNGVFGGGASSKISLFYGSGVGTFDYIYQSNGQTTGIGYRICAEVGVIGFVLFALCVFFCYQKNTTLYSKGCSKKGKLMSLAALSAMTAILSIGFDSNVFADQTVCMMFWMCVGLSSCVSGTEKHEHSIDEDPACFK